ncbi:MAG: dethiobiotin synthase [Verrucomicrobia bacterium]|nr:dethiobiotin synthase [Verrucomicrobiota bacterium]
MNYFVTGTDTGVGKTFVVSGLVRCSRSRGIDAVGMKPICTGDNADVRRLLEACGFCEPEHIINPVWYRTPVAPYTASMIESRLIDLDAIRQVFEQLARRHSGVLVEGAGGIMVPIFADYDFRDLARDLHLNVLIVAANRLGVLNHARLTVEAARRAGLKTSLIILNSMNADPDISEPTNLSVLENLVDVPVLAVEHNQHEFEELSRRLW